MPRSQSRRVPFRRHSIQCYAISSPQFGEVCSCMGALFAELSTVLTQLDIFFPGTLALMFQKRITFMECEQLLQAVFNDTQSSTLTDATYHTSKILIDSLGKCIYALEKSQTLRSNILSQLAYHAVSTSINVRIVVNNLNQFLEASYSVRRMVQLMFWSMLDNDPAASSEKLAGLMAFVRQKFSSVSKVSGDVLGRNLLTLGVRMWLDDEIINHFVNKWCTQSHSTVGISSFFAEKFLFRESDCHIVCEVDQLVADNQLRNKVLRWVQKTQHRQNLSKFDQVYIPINGSHCHWYSACIDYRRKRIDIYDSLREVCVFNRSKPPELRQNRNLMIVLMWLCELLATLRPSGESVELTHSGQNWTYDPHAIVPFQPNTYDCGVHTLWHLKHIIEFGSIRPEDSTSLRFTQDMVGKRIRLAQELLDEQDV